MKLFIIGNGFDQNHGYKTGYKDFRNYLIQNNYSIDGTFSLSDFFNNEDENLWSDFENRLGEVDYEEIGSYYSSDLTDDLSDKEWNRASSNNRYLCEEFESVVTRFKPCLCQAVSDFVTEAVNYNKSVAKKKFRKLFSPNDLFVSFNYTRTLEELYGISDSNILHLHGVAYHSIYENDEYPSEYDEEPSIIFGHGDFIADMDKNVLLEQNPFNPHEIFKALPALLKKDYQNDALEFFLGKNKSVVEIEIIGHGLGSVDSCYFKQISKLLPNVAKVTYWHYCEDEESKSIKIEKVKRCFSKADIKIKSY